MADGSENKTALGLAERAITALSVSPPCLAAVIMSVLFMVLVYRAAEHEHERVHERFTTLMRYCPVANDTHGLGRRAAE